jgi:chromosome partitioning protein
MKTIAVINMKGGCAKTTTTVNMAYILANDYGKKVLLIDNDKQGNLSKACGVWSDSKPSIADMLTGQEHITDILQAGPVADIAVIPANMHLLTANLAVIKNEKINQATILADELEQVKDIFDYCIIDCPPDINISVINALVAADEVIIPIKIDGYAFDGMDELEEQINNAKKLNPRLRLKGCLVTMFYNRDVCRQGEMWLQNQRYPVFKTHIRRSEKADEVTFSNQSLIQYSPRSGAARDYKEFVKEYLEG